LYRPGHQETIAAILVVARHQAHAAETQRAIQLRARDVAGPHHQLDTTDARRAQLAERVPHERIGHTAPAIVRMDGERGDLRVALLRAGHRVAGDAAAHLGHHEKFAAIVVQLQEVPARPGLGAEAGAFDPHDAREMAQPERNDLDRAGQRAWASALQAEAGSADNSFGANATACTRTSIVPGTPGLCNSSSRTRLKNFCW